MRAAYLYIGDAFVKEEPRTLFMKSKNGQLIKDSQYLTLWSQENCKNTNFVNCCGMSRHVLFEIR